MNSNANTVNTSVKKLSAEANVQDTFKCKFTTDKIIKSVSYFITLGLFTSSMSSALASGLNHSSVSYGSKTNQFTAETRNLVIAQNSNSLVYDQLIGKALGKTRKDIIIQKQQTVKKLQNSLDKNSIDNNAETQSNKNNLTTLYAPLAPSLTSPVNVRVYTPEFSIYDASSFLEDDIDGDGFYKTFGVVFDVDVYNPNGNENSVIYAELYISTNGGSWKHYYTTDDFLIQGSNEEDQFEVITTFAQGYTGAYYDILIDIYEVGYSEIVATYSADDDNALYALPLESAENDTVYVDEVIVVHGGGSNSMMFLLFIFCIAIFKRVFKTRKLTANKCA